LLTLAVLDSFHSSELRDGFAPRVGWGHACLKIVGRLKREMFFDFGLQPLFIPLRRGPGRQPAEESSE
jgi:hypothetical protein